MSFELYPHQHDFLNDIRSKIKNGKSRVVGQAPTGFGKTVVATEIATSAVARGHRVWFVVHRKELLMQTHDAFISAGLIPDFIAAGKHYRNAQVSLCSVQTLTNRMGKVVWPDICIWDEAHHCPSTSYSRIMDVLTNTLHIGLTATPYRLDGRGLKDFFECIVPGPKVSWLIEHKYLADYEVYSTPMQIDTQGIKKIAGDYSKKELAAAADRPDITGNAVKHYQELCAGKQALGFCINVEHSKHTTAAFKTAGIRAEHIDATTDKVERKETVQAFRDGKVDILFNVDLFGEGVDVPAVECAILLRPTASLSLYLQQVGRALRRKKSGAKAIILDHAGNVMRHGLPDDDREWSLEGTKKSGSSEANELIRQCPMCFHVHRPAPDCPKCGHAYVFVQNEITVDEKTELTKIDKEQLRKSLRKQQGASKDLAGLIALGRARGYKAPERWAQHVIDGRKLKKAR